MSTTTASARWVRLIAVATIAGSALLLSGCSLINQVTHATQRDASGTPTAANVNADVFSIKVGDCLNDATATGTVTTAPIVPCSKPHDSEAYASITMKDGAFPGTDAVKAQADQACPDAFPDFVGIAYNDSTLSISYYYPTSDSWANGDREILCTVYDDGVKTTGTLKNAKR
ncbi:MAG TPA: septum formation family protein [Pseudolysinimonas sp.]|nr:septum formation family protein [Pseudolysinimonas sp.]